MNSETTITVAHMKCVSVMTLQHKKDMRKSIQRTYEYVYSVFDKLKRLSKSKIHFSRYNNISRMISAKNVALTTV